MRKTFKSGIATGFCAGLILALFIVPLGQSAVSRLKESVARKRGFGTVCMHKEAALVSKGIPSFSARYHLTDFDGTNVYAPLYDSVKKNTYDADSFIIENDFRFYVKDDEKKSKIGIDVSKYQSAVDWNQVKAAGIDFVIVRVGFRGYGEEGKIVLDENFVSHIEGAQAAGLETGVYFFSQAVNEKEAKEEAEAVIEAIKAYDITYPVVFDTELIADGKARAGNLTVKELTNIAIEFCECVKMAGYQPMIYANERWFLLHLDLRKLTEYPLWLASYRERATFPYEMKMWQYTEKGHVDGVTGDVDLNIYFP